MKFWTSTTSTVTWSHCAGVITRAAWDAPASRRESTFVRCGWGTSRGLMRNVELPGDWPIPCPRQFIAYILTEETPDHSTIWRIRRLDLVERHKAVFRG